MNTDANLPALIDRARSRLGQVRTSAEALEVRGIADALLHRGNVVNASNEVHADILRIIVRAERLVGRNLIEAKATGERAGEGRPKKLSSVTTVSDLSITRDQAAYWQQIARTPEAAIEQAIQDVLAEGRRPLKSDISDAVKNTKGQGRTRRRTRRGRKRTQLEESELVKQYNVKELGGWILAATDDFLNSILWDDELVPQEAPTGFVIGAITVTRHRETREITIKIPELIPTHIIDDARTDVAFRLIKVMVPEDDED